MAIPLMQGTSGMFHFLIGLVIAYIGGFLVTSLFIKEKDVKEEEEIETEWDAAKTDSQIFAPVDGQCI